MTLLLKCRGFQVSGYNVPGFEIQSKNFCRINMPFKLGSYEDREILYALLNKKKHPSIEFGNSPPLHCGDIYRQHHGISDFFRSDKVITRLTRYYNIEKKDIFNMLSSLKIKNDIYWDSLPLFKKCLLSFETASACSMLIFFDTAGLDPLSIEKIYDIALIKSKRGHAVIHLSYPVLSENRFKSDKEFIVFL